MLPQRAELDRDRCCVWSASIMRRLYRSRFLHRAGSIFVYVSCGTEVYTGHLIRSLLRQGRKVCVPRIISGHSMRAVAIRRWSDLVTGRYGIQAPRSIRPVGNVAVAIVPGLAFGTRGERLGLGAGYYDRWFAAQPQALRVAIAYEAQLVPYLPMMTHDKRMHAIITEKRIIRASRAAS